MEHGFCTDACTHLWTVTELRAWRQWRRDVFPARMKGELQLQTAPIRLRLEGMRLNMNALEASFERELSVLREQTLQNHHLIRSDYEDLVSWVQRMFDQARTKVIRLHRAISERIFATNARISEIQTRILEIENELASLRTRVANVEEIVTVTYF